MRPEIHKVGLVGFPIQHLDELVKPYIHNLNELYRTNNFTDEDMFEVAIKLLSPEEQYSPNQHHHAVEFYVQTEDETVWHTKLESKLANGKVAILFPLTKRGRVEKTELYAFTEMDKLQQSINIYSTPNIGPSVMDLHLKNVTEVMQAYVQKLEPQSKHAHEVQGKLF